MKGEEYKKEVLTLLIWSFRCYDTGMGRPLTLRMIPLFLLFFCLTLSGCGLLRPFFESEERDLASIKESLYTNKDYSDQMAYLGRQYKNLFPESFFVHLSLRHELYLRTIVRRAIDANELLLRKDFSVRIMISLDKRPYFFSLPNGSIFISLGLIKKYIRQEGDLVSLIVGELIRSAREYYYKQIVVPTGVITLEQMLLLTKLKLEDKIELNHWIFYVLKRSGYDPYNYLTWIQLLNKNSHELSLVVGSDRDIALEEYDYKKFLLMQQFDKKMKNNSSDSFYLFLSDMKNRDYEKN